MRCRTEPACRGVSVPRVSPGTYPCRPSRRQPLLPGHQSTRRCVLRSLAGCTAVVNYSTEDFVERTFELTGGQGVKAVYDSVGKDTFRGSLAVLRPRGTLVQFGNASGSPEPISPFELAPRALYLTWAILPHYNNTPEALAASSADLFDAIQSGI